MRGVAGTSGAGKHSGGTVRSIDRGGHRYLVTEYDNRSFAKGTRAPPPSAPAANPAPGLRRLLPRRAGNQRSTRCPRPGGGSYGSGHKSVTRVISPSANSKNAIASSVRPPGSHSNHATP